MDICQKCKHWGTREPYRISAAGIAAGIKVCGRVLPQWIVEDRVITAKQESAVKADPHENWFHTDMSAALAQVKAVTQDGSDYNAELLTTPDFGCVLFEGK